MPNPEFVVGDPGTWITPDASVDADLSDDRWFQFVPTSSAYEDDGPPPGSLPDPPPSIISADIPNLDDRPPAGAGRDQWAADVLLKAWQELFNTAPSPQALQAAQAIARLESMYGWPSETKHPEWQGHHNWGSVHCMMRVDGKLKSCMQDGVCVKGFMSTDKINGVRTPTCFSSFPTNVEGAKYFLTQLLVRRPNVMAVIDSANAYRIALEMRKTSYFMREKTRDPEKIKADAAYYAGAMMGSAKTIAANRKTKMLLTQTVPDKVDPSSPKDASWPRDVTDLTNYSPASTSASTLGPVSGILVGIGLGVLGVWGYKKWVKNEVSSRKHAPPRQR